MTTLWITAYLVLLALHVLVQLPVVQAQACASEVLVDSDIGLKDSEFAVVQCADWECCCNQCFIRSSEGPDRKENICSHWVFHYAGSGFCYLKDSARSDPAIRAPLAGFVAGVAANHITSGQVPPARVAPKPTCRGFCGLQSRGGCLCDSLCIHYGDCCTDFEEQCEALLSTVKGPQASFFATCIRNNTGHGTSISAHLPGYCGYLASALSSKKSLDRQTNSHHGVQPPTIALIQNSAVSSFPVEDYGGAERAIEVLAAELQRLRLPFFVVIPRRREGAARGHYPFQVCETVNAPALDALPALDVQALQQDPQAQLRQFYLANLKFAEEVLRLLASHPQRDNLVIWSQEAWSANLAFLGRPQVITTHASMGKQSWIAPEIYGQAYNNIRVRFISQSQRRTWFPSAVEFQDEMQLSSVVPLSLEAKYFGSCASPVPRVGPFESVGLNGLNRVAKCDPIDHEQTDSMPRRCFLPTKGRKLAMWMAGLNWGLRGKGLDVFIALATRRPDIDFVAYGAGFGDVEVIAAIQAAESSLSNFLFAGSLHSDNHTAAYCEADVFITPTRNDEAFGRTIIEAAARGTPIIGSNNGAVPGLIQSVDHSLGVVCDVDNLECFSQGLDKILGKDEEEHFTRAKISSAAAKRFLAAQEVDQLLRQTLLASAQINLLTPAALTVSPLYRGQYTDVGRLTGSVVNSIRSSDVARAVRRNFPMASNPALQEADLIRDLALALERQGVPASESSKWRHSVLCHQQQRRMAEQEWRDGRGFIWLQHIRKSGGSFMCELFKLAAQNAPNAQQRDLFSAGDFACMLPTYAFLDLNQHSPPDRLRALMKANHVRVVAQEYGPLPAQGLDSPHLVLESPERLYHQSNEANQNDTFDDWVFVTTLRDPQKRMESHLRYAFPRCITQGDESMLRRCILDNHDLESLVAKVDPKSGKPMAPYMEFPFQLKGFRYFDNYLTRILSGNIERDHVSRADFLLAISRLHRFSSIWDLNDLDATSAQFWAAFSGRPDIGPNSMKNIWSTNTSFAGVATVSQDDVNAMWTRYPTILTEWRRRNSFDAQLHGYATRLGEIFDAQHAWRYGDDNHTKSEMAQQGATWEQDHTILEDEGVWLKDAPVRDEKVVHNCRSRYRWCA